MSANKTCVKDGFRAVTARQSVQPAKALPSSAPAVYKPVPLPLSAPKPCKTQLPAPAMQLKPAGNFRLETRPAPPAFSAQAGMPFASPAKSPAGFRCVQLLYGQNTPAKFETEKGSTYTVTVDDVLRDKFDKTKHGGKNKNIFYTDEQTAKTIRGDLKKKNGATNVRVVGLTLTYEINGSTKSFNLSDTPKVGLRPLDMILDKDGNYAGKIHKGHKITKIL